MLRRAHYFLPHLSFHSPFISLFVVPSFCVYRQDRCFFIFISKIQISSEEIKVQLGRKWMVWKSCGEMLHLSFNLQLRSNNQINCIALWCQTSGAEGLFTVCDVYYIPWLSGTPGNFHWPKCRWQSLQKWSLHQKHLQPPGSGTVRHWRTPSHRPLRSAASGEPQKTLLTCSTCISHCL